MKNLNQLSNNPSFVKTTAGKPSELPPRGLLVLFLLVALIGFVDAAYLTVLHFLNSTPPCSILEGCEQVTTSKYAMLGSIPISLIGAVYYLVIFLLSIAALDTGRRFPMRAAIVFTWGGFAVSLFLVALQLFVIKALCLYCMVSAFTTLVLFILGLVLLQYKKKE
ncbi:MAG: vitamin K epoxide reductase family protein [Candidatus Niyogibacteria bacterium]|nr:vitamin K epoxide reductase family protein [Candidatus Niyogibacteria bacterium]